MTFNTTSTERLFQTQDSPVRAARRRFIVLFVVCLLAHAGILYVLLFGASSFDPPIAPPTQEIPIEIVTEPPPPAPAEPPAPKQQQPENTLDEKPATDAPRAANKETIEREAPDEASKAPHVAPPTEQAAPQPTPENKPVQAEQSESQTAAPASSPMPAEVKPDAEALDKAEKQHEKPDANGTDSESKPQPEKSIADLLAGFEPLPDYKFGSAAKTTPVSGGKAKSTYLTILYGLIVPHLTWPPRPSGGPSHAEGTVAFNIDGSGRLTYQSVVRSSGVQALDAAALAAVRQASPFPAPPAGLPLGLSFTYSAR